MILRTNSEWLNCSIVLTIQSHFMAKLNFNDIFDAYFNEKAGRQHFEIEIGFFFSFKLNLHIHQFINRTIIL